ncbi:MAG: ABC transporter permease [Anaerolineae bacterium]|jgi:peptide/nickel transport system permease protein|nr:ABC transporter permease [Anaerolineae bacterium]
MANATTASNVVKLDGRREKAESLLKITVRRFLRHRMAVIGLVTLSLIILFVSVGALFFTEQQANSTTLTAKYTPPGAEYPLGTDRLGRDILARSIYGGQISLMIGITAVAISITIGTAVGLVSGYFGGWIDSILMRFVEAMLAIPTLILLIVIQPAMIQNATTRINILGRELSVTVVAIVVIIGITSWLGLSRIVRSMVLSLKEQEFVAAARMVGASDTRIIFTHILPNCIAPIVVSATLGVGSAIVTETALGFLGFGVQEPTATWGNILSGARQFVDDYPWIWLAPGVLITLTVLSINFIGDGLRDALDPRSRQ